MRRTNTEIRIGSTIGNWVWSLSFTMFVALKVSGVSVWSWWWVLMPLVPVFAWWFKL